MHATVHQFQGLDYTRLTYQHSGRQVRLTDTAGDIVKDILALAVRG